ncbi:CRE-NPP-22 protein [Aphelenchoides avenae]|nr:CRE-NPP-22 protein [Aphelenchus avenae]
MRSAASSMSSYPSAAMPSNYTRISSLLCKILLFCFTIFSVVPMSEPYLLYQTNDEPSLQSQEYVLRKGWVVGPFVLSPSNAIPDSIEAAAPVEDGAAVSLNEPFIRTQKALTRRCGIKLMQHVVEICNGCLQNPNTKPIMMKDKRSGMMGAGYKKITRMCCENACDDEELRTFCSDFSSVPSTFGGHHVHYEDTPPSSLKYRPTAAVAKRPILESSSAFSSSMESCRPIDSIRLNESHRSIGSYTPTESYRPSENYAPSEQRYPQSTELLGWFTELIQSRQRYASRVVSGISAAIFGITILLLQVSLFAPFDTIQLNLGTLLSVGFWVVLALQAASCYLLSDFLIRYVLSPFYERNLNLKKRENALAFAALLVVHFVHVVVATLYVEVELSWSTSNSAWWLLVLTSLVSSFRLAFLSDYRYQFPPEQRNLNMWSFVRWYLRIAEDTPLAHCFAEALRSIIVSWPIMLVLALVNPTLRPSILSLLNPAVLLETLIVVGAQQVSVSSVISVINAFVMRPLLLKMPSVYFAVEGSASNPKTLVNALRSDDHFLTLFAFRDLRVAVSASALDRSDVYALSQPGGHPRNWSAVRDACLTAIRRLQEQLEGEAEKARAGTYRILEKRVTHSPSDLDETRATLLLPPSLQPRNYVVPQLRPAVPLWQRVPLPPALVTAIEWVQKTFFAQPPSIATHTFCLVKNAVNALTVLVAHSITEDQFGVVLKDVSAVISALLQLEMAVDEFVGAKKAPGLAEVRNALRIEAVLTDSINMLKREFGEHITSMKLSQRELEVLQAVASP